MKSSLIDVPSLTKKLFFGEFKFIISEHSFLIGLFLLDKQPYCSKSSATIAVIYYLVHSVAQADFVCILLL